MKAKWYSELLTKMKKNVKQINLYVKIYNCCLIKWEWAIFALYFIHFRGKSTRKLEKHIIDTFVLTHKKQLLI